MHYTKISSLYHLMGEGFEGGKRTGAEALCVRLRARLHHCVSVCLICLSAYHSFVSVSFYPGFSSKRACKAQMNFTTVPSVEQ